MWTLEADPALRSELVCVTLLDSPPDEARLRANVGAAIADIPRLRQRVLAPPLRIAPPEWAPSVVELDYHVQKVTLPAPGGLRDLLDLAAAIGATPFDPERPLWQFFVVQGFHGDGGEAEAALIEKLHHSVTDGVRGLRLSLRLVDTRREPEADPAPADERVTVADDAVPERSRVEVTRDAVLSSVGRNLRLAGAVAGAGVALVRHPSRLPGTVGAGIEVGGSIRRQLLVTGSARSPVTTARSAARQFEVLTVPFAPAKEAAAILGGSLNDLYVTAVARALGRYHEERADDEHGDPVDELRMAMPVNLVQGEDGAGNHFAPARVLVPIRPVDPAILFARVHRALAPLRGESALQLTDGLAGIAGVLPAAVLIAAFRSQARTIDFSASNLRGSPVPLYVAGSRIVANFAFGPRSGSPLNVTLMSYAGELQIGCNVDPAAIDDPGQFVALLAESFDRLLAFASPAPTA
ncbi:MAG: Wax ester synthase-like Acyl-CoA acyltransferase domain [Actinomycetia bacterium]|nr:Wax ester synthase-like Acyl-CoA acyltransferase domain [Actinomycetes bacterium]